jgi:hypothetical protein
MIEASQQPGPGESGLSQELESHNLSSLNAASLLEHVNSKSSHVSSGDITSDTSLSQRIEGGAFKEPKKWDRHQRIASDRKSAPQGRLFPIKDFGKF